MADRFYATDFEHDAIALLKSIDSSMKQILAVRQAHAPKPVASDRDLDGKYGNPVVKFMPRDWAGEDCKGLHMSDCPPAMLDMLAETFDYFARKAEETGEMTNAGKPVADYKKADAARARGWAKRIREGKVPASAASQKGSATDSDWGEKPEW